MTAAAPRRFEVLDAWRGIAALAVAVRHINGTPFFLSGQFHGQLSYAVDFFFVLSGFVIAASYGERLAGGFSLLRFFVLRWGRVWPLHAMMVLLYLLLECVFWLKGGGGVLVGRQPFTGPRDWAALLPSLFLVQTWIWPSRDLWNTQSWSISVEVALYIGAALLWRGLGRRAAVAAVIAAALALWALDSGTGLDNMMRGVAGFGLGVGCWAVWPHWRRLALPGPAASALEAGLLACVIWALSEGARYSVVDPLFALFVLAFAREGGGISRLLLTAPARWLGTLSYALYMVHGLVIGRVFDLAALLQARLGARWVSAHLGGADQILLPPVPALALTLVMLAASLAAAWAAWAFVEWPARAFSRRIAARIGADAPSLQKARS